MKQIKTLVNAEIEKLKKASNVLFFSYNQIKLFKEINSLSDDELVIVEAFNSRFCKLADIFLQSSLKPIDEVDLENKGTARDRINRAEKSGIIIDAQIQIEIRYLRNTMAHEYIIPSINLLFEKAKTLTPLLIEDVVTTINYLNKILSL